MHGQVQWMDVWYLWQNGGFRGCGQDLRTVTAFFRNERLMKSQARERAEAKGHVEGKSSANVEPTVVGLRKRPGILKQVT
jgi:hypothetical protein